MRPRSARGPASAGPFRVAALGLAIAILATGSACKVGKGTSDEDAQNALPKRLGAKPAIVDPAGAPPPRPTPVTGPDGSTSTTQGGGANPSSPTPKPGTATTTPPAAPFRTVATTADPMRDAGLEAPPYDDLISLRIDDNGTSVRFTVEFTGAVPAQLPQGEIMGVGVDVFHGQKESSFQVFAEGSVQGWLAYLQVGEDFVKYPGTFELAGNKLVFAVPWADVGGRKAGSMAAFADWSKEGAVLASVGADKAPDRGATGFQP